MYDMYRWPQAAATQENSRPDHTAQRAGHPVTRTGRGRSGRRVRAGRARAARECRALGAEAVQVALDRRDNGGDAAGCGGK